MSIVHRPRKKRAKSDRCKIFSYAFVNFRNQRDLRSRVDISRQSSWRYSFYRMIMDGGQNVSFLKTALSDDVRPSVINSPGKLSHYHCSDGGLYSRERGRVELVVKLQIQCPWTAQTEVAFCRDDWILEWVKTTIPWFLAPRQSGSTAPIIHGYISVGVCDGENAN